MAREAVGDDIAQFSQPEIGTFVVYQDVGAYEYDARVADFDAWVEASQAALFRFLNNEWNGATEQVKLAAVQTFNDHITALRNWYKDQDKSGMPVHWEDHTVCAGQTIAAELANQSVELTERTIDAALSHPNHQVALCAAKYRRLSKRQMSYLEQHLPAEEFEVAATLQQELE